MPSDRRDGRECRSRREGARQADTARVRSYARSNAYACRLLCVSFFVLVSCTNNTPCRLSKVFGVSGEKRTTQNGGLFNQFLTCGLSAHHMNTIHDSKSLHVHCAFTFLTITLARPRLLDKQSLQKSVFDTVKNSQTPVYSPLSTLQTEPSSNFPTGHREQPVLLGTAQFVVSLAPTHDNSFIAARRRCQSTNSTCQDSLGNTPCRSQRTRRPRHDIRLHCSTPPLRYRTVVVTFVMQLIPTTLPSLKTT